jgi:hypothetical protein
MDTFSPDNWPRLVVALNDPGGVSRVAAFFKHVAEEDSCMVLTGDGGGQTEAVVVLTPSESSGFLAAGEYRCYRMEASSLGGFRRVLNSEADPETVNRTFWYEYPRGENDNPEGPEFVGFLNNAIALLTASDWTTNDLRKYAQILRDTIESDTSVEQAQATVQVEIPGLAPLTQEIARARSANLRMFLV